MDNQEAARGTDVAAVRSGVPLSDELRYIAEWTVEKYADDEAFQRGETYEVLKFQDNVLLTLGISLMIDLLVGAGGTVYNNANAYMAVGTGTAAETAGVSTLTGEVRKAMDATYPLHTAGTTTVTWRSTYASADANQVWAEAGVRNASTAGTLLNRRLQAMGTKASGTTWTISLAITIT